MADDLAQTGLADLLRELVAWHRLVHQGQLRRVLSELLSTPNDRAAYEATDGTRNQTEVGKVVGITSRAVGYKWEDWRRAGVLVEGQDPKKPRHLVSLESLGDLPAAT